MSAFDHHDEVIKARAMPHDLSLVASMTNTGVIKLYDIPEIKLVETEGHQFAHQEYNFTGKREKAEFVGLEEESFALSWNKYKKGLLCSAAAQTICIWTVDGGDGPTMKFENAHTDSIHDVKFSTHEQHGGHLLISTSEDGHFKIWDVRNDAKNFTHAFKAGEDSLCVGQFNPINENLFAVAGDSTGQIQVWDLRMTQQAINIL